MFINVNVFDLTSMLSVVLFVALCVCIYVACGRWKRSHKLPPVYPGALPIIGHSHLLLVDTAKLWLLLEELGKVTFKAGGVMHAILGTQIYYLITDVDDALTAATACLRRHFAVDFIKPWLGEGLVTANENLWKRNRKLINPAFSLPVVHGFLDVFNSQAKNLATTVEPYVGKGAFCPIDKIREKLFVTLCQSTFGISESGVPQKFREVVDILPAIGTKRFQTVWWHSDFLYNFSSLKKKEQDATKDLKEMSHKIIEKKKAAIKNVDVDIRSQDFINTGVKYKPALELLLELSRDGIFTEKQVTDETHNIIITGYETIANELMYTLLFLGAYPEAQNKVLKEILEVVGPTRDVEKDDLLKLVYTNAVVLESTRLLPAVPVVLRTVLQDVKLKNYTMRAGSQCILLPLLHPQDPMWGPSGDKFRPERWIENPELSWRKEFAGFGLGRRGCIGKPYAIVALKVFVAQFIRQYEVTSDISKLKLKMDFILKPIAGTEISITKRNLDC